MNETQPAGGANATWAPLLETPSPGEHVVQLSPNAEFLAGAVGRFVSEAVGTGGAALLVSTTRHRRPIMRELKARGLPLRDLERRGQLVVLDADRTLARLLVAGVPARPRFRKVIGGVVSAMKAAGHARIRAFGEMVDVMRRTSIEEAFRLEALWSELLAEHGIALLCAYSIDPFEPRSYDGVLQRVVAAHTRLVPVEDSPRLDGAVERAYQDVFGRDGDGVFLRRAFIRHYARPASMPDGQAAIMAAHAFVPETVRLILDRVRRHYEAVAPAPDREAAVPPSRGSSAVR